MEINRWRAWNSADRGGLPTVMLTAFSLVIALAAPYSAKAAIIGSCNPNRSHDNAARYVITASVVSGINGLSSNILELSPYYSGSNGTGTNATIMLVNTTHSKWAQLGWFKSKIADGSTVKRDAGLEFYLSSSQNSFQWFGSKQVQTQTWYEILYDNNKFDFFVGGTFVATYSGFTPGEYQMFGETHDLADQMPGVSSNVETFRQSTYWTGVNHGTQHTITSPISTDTRYYGGQNLGGGTYYAWDRCGTFAASQLKASGDGGAVNVASEPIAKTSSSPWSPASAALSSEDLATFAIETAEDVSGQRLAADAAAGWGLSEAEALSAAAKEIEVTADSRAYRATVIRFPREQPRAAWIVTTPGGSLPFDGPQGGPVVAAPRLTGVILDPDTGDLWRGFMH